MTQTHVFLATPCYGGMVTRRYFHSVMRCLFYCAAESIHTTVETLAGDSLISRARNTLVAKFLAHEQATHLLFVDADIGFEPAHLAALLDLGVDMAACVYPIKQAVWSDSAVARARAGEAITTAPLDYVGVAVAPPEGRRRGAFVTAEYAGTGFLLISRAALTRMISAYPALRYDSAHVPLDARAEFLYALFDTSIDPVTRAYLSEDYTFCARWRALGGDIWLHTEACLTHVGGQEFVGNPGCREWRD